MLAQKKTYYIASKNSILLMSYLLVVASKFLQFLKTKSVFVCTIVSGSHLTIPAFIRTLI